jgi:ATP-dependent DNA helicase RecQ
VAAGFLQIDIGGYGGLKLTEAGEALLKGERGFRYRPVVADGRAVRRKAAGAAEQDMSPHDADLLARLKRVRLELAKERGVPAFVIFADRSLQDMARRRPRSKREFAEVHGVGEAKLKEFAEVFLEAIGAGHPEEG